VVDDPRHPSIVLDKVDVGGSEAFIRSRDRRGGNNESGYFIDGIEVSSLDGNGTGATFYLNPYAFQEASYQVGGPGTAAQSKGGLIYNVISRTGTNEFHGSTMFNGSNRGMSSRNFSDALRTELLAGVPAAALRANPNIVPGADILKTYDTGAWISGPIIRDRVWFSGSVHYQVLDQYPLGSYDVDASRSSTTTSCRPPRRRSRGGSAGASCRGSTTSTTSGSATATDECERDELLGEPRPRPERQVAQRQPGEVHDPDRHEHGRRPPMAACARTTGSPSSRKCRPATFRASTR
jgi:hypothetical protein